MKNKLIFDVENCVFTSAASTTQCTFEVKMLIRLFKKNLALVKSLFNIVIGNLFPGTY